jgi:hypothetical protein
MTTEAATKAAKVAPQPVPAKVEWDFRAWWQRNWNWFLLDCLFLPCMGLMYWTVNAEGLRITFPAMATKLYKVPLASLFRLGHWKLFHEIDIAPFFALAMLIVVFSATTRALTVVSSSAELL